MGKIYFAHAVNSYNTPIETAFEILIANELTGGDRTLIENPNQPKHQEGYNKYAARSKPSDTKHKGMNYFYDEVIPQCTNGCVGVPFLDMRLGLGVAGEMKLNIELKRPTWIVAINQPTITKKDLRKFVEDPSNGLFYVRLIKNAECDLILNTDPKTGSGSVLSHEETRLRTWKVYNHKKRPYEEAHLARMPIPAGFYPED